MKKGNKDKFKLKDSYFNGFEYKGYHVRTKLVIEGQNEYKPLQFSNSAEVYNAFKKLRAIRNGFIRSSWTRKTRL